MRCPLTLLVCFLLTACTQPGPGPCPVDVEQLAPAVAELHLVEAFKPEVPPLVRDSVMELYHANVLEEYDLTPESFDSLTDIVRSEPVWIDSLYRRVNDILAEREALRRGGE